MGTPIVGLKIHVDVEVAGSFDFHNKACVYDFLCVRLNEPFLTQMYAKIESISFLDWL